MNGDPGGVIGELSSRGLVHQITSDELAAALARERQSIYIGFDPTATSLHAGSLIPLLGLQRFRNYGHRPIVLLGGATGLIGDPSGKSAERVLETEETVRARGEAMRAQVQTFFEKLDGPPPLFVNNLDWLSRIGMLEFLRDIGKHFSVNQMIQRDSVKRRFETEGQGISFTEFTYSLLQSADFLELYRRYGCKLQGGASDQWGNIVSGIDLIRRCADAEAFGITFPLLTTSEGKKFGKTERGAIWLDPRQTSPYRFYQFWINVEDADVARFLRWFTFLPLEKIAELEATVSSGTRDAQRALALEVTRIVHGEAEAERARAASEALFRGDVAELPVNVILDIAGDVPTLRQSAQCFGGDGMPLADLLVQSGAAGSKSEGRRLIRQNAIRLNGVAISASEEERRVTVGDFRERRVLVIQRGKRNTHVVIMEGAAVES